MNEKQNSIQFQLKLPQKK